MRRTRRLALIPATVAALALACGASNAVAATFTVSTTSDSGGSCPTPTTCSLRQAVETSDAAPGDDTIDFALPAPSVISLTNGELVFTSDERTTIAGPGAGALTVRRDPSAPPHSVILNFGTATITGLTISGGLSGRFEGGGIQNDGDLTIDGVVVSANNADAASEGSVAGAVNGGVMTVRNSTFEGNTTINAGAGGSAGAIVQVGALLVVNSTFTGNRVTGAGDAGGAILNFTPLTTIVNSTIAGNVVAQGAGGILSDGNLALANSILAGNLVATAANDCVGSVTSRGYTLLGTTDRCALTAATGDVIGANPLLGPLAANGGPTPTMALLAGSPAIDAGNPAATSDADPPAPPALVPCRTTDQRGVARPQGARCDIGAFELQPLPTPPPPPPPVPPPPPPAQPPLPPPPPPFVAPDVDHIKCYAATQPGFEPRTVLLSDQFMTRRARLRKVTDVCNPASKNGSRVKRPRADLVCYASRDRTPSATRRALVSDQFGTRTVVVHRADRLCVPSRTSVGTAPLASGDPARAIDHFRCYRATGLRTVRTVQLSDRFGTTRTRIVSLARLCNPVRKNAEGVRRPDAHLTCYAIRDILSSTLGS